MNILANDLTRHTETFRDELDAAYKTVLNSGWYILGKEVDLFEREFADYLGTQHCVGLASGLDALVLAFRLLGIGRGDEVLVASNAYIACVMGITANDATPVFVEPDGNYNIDASRIESHVTEKTKAILAVHLYGRPCDMDGIAAVAEKHNLKIVEDCAQSHGARCGHGYTGALGDIACFSFYPTKNLGAFGDGGCLSTNDSAIAERCRTLRNYGRNAQHRFSEVGLNSRLDEMQAAFLRVKLKHLEETNAIRRKIARAYLRGIIHPEIALPEWDDGHVWHQFVVRSPERDVLRAYLREHSVCTEVHYPIPPHLSECYAYLGYQEADFRVAEQYSREVLSLPMYPGLSDMEIAYIVDTVNAWRGIN